MKKKVLVSVVLMLLLSLVLSVPAYCRVVNLNTKKKVVVVQRGEPITLNIQEEGVSYQWLKKTQGGEWKKCHNGGSSLKLKCSNYRKHKVKCNVLTSAGEVHKKTVTLLVASPKLQIEEQPEDTLARVNSNVQLTVKLADERSSLIRYSWEKYKGGKWKPIKGANKKYYRFKYNGHLARYRCKIWQSRVKGVIYSKTATIVSTCNVSKTNQSKIQVLKGFVIPKNVDGYVFIYCCDPKYIRLVKEAIKKLNKYVGTFFVYTYDSQFADVVVTTYDIEKESTSYPEYMSEDILSECIKNKDWLGVAFSDDIFNIHYLIALNDTRLNICRDEYVVAVIEHELFHCINIGHSKDNNSIMYPTLDSGAYITATDIKLFKEKVSRFRGLLASVL